MTFNKLCDERIKKIEEMVKSVTSYKVFDPSVVLIKLYNNDPYIDKVADLCREWGIFYTVITIPQTETREKMLKTVNEICNLNYTSVVLSIVDWVLLDVDLLSMIPPEKDVQCITPYNIGTMYGFPHANRYLPNTDEAMLNLIYDYCKEQDYFPNINIKSILSHKKGFYMDILQDAEAHITLGSDEGAIICVDIDCYTITEDDKSVLDIDKFDGLQMAYLMQNIIRAAMVAEKQND